MSFNTVDLLNILPLLIVAGLACVVLLVTVFSRDNQAFIAAFSATGLLVAGIFAIPQVGLETDAFGGTLSIDGFASFINFLLLGAGLLSIALSHDYLQRMNLARGEYYALMLFSISGMMLMGMAADLIVVFLALELLSIPLYVLAAFARPQARSEEAGLKYFLLGAFSSGFLLYGIALVYGATGSTAFHEIVAAVAGGLDQPLYLVLGAGLILVGLGVQ